MKHYPDVTQEVIEKMNWWVAFHQSEVQRVANVLAYWQQLRGNK